jgi:hypothetical protein
VWNEAVVDDIDAWVPSTSMPPGTAIRGGHRIRWEVRHLIGDLYDLAEEGFTGAQAGSSTVRAGRGKR